MALKSILSFLIRILKKKSDEVLRECKKNPRLQYDLLSLDKCSTNSEEFEKNSSQESLKEVYKSNPEKAGTRNLQYFKKLSKTLRISKKLWFWKRTYDFLQ